MMHKDEVAELLAMLVAAFPRTAISERTLDLYTMALVDAEPEHAIAAIATFTLRGKGFPTLAELRDEIARGAGDGVPDPDLAWKEVLRAVSRWGAYGEPKFTHRAVVDAVDALSWREICLSENMPALRAHFDKAYAQTSKRAADPLHHALVDKLTTQLGDRFRTARQIAGTTTPQLEGAKVKP